MITLEEAKTFCRIDNDAEDEQIKAFIAAADSFIETACGSNYNKDGAKAKLAQRILINNWYENRDVRGNSKRTLPYTLDSILTQIRYDAEKESGGTDEIEPVQ